MKILVADDHVTIRRVLAETLSSWDYEVVLAEDGVRAWEILTDDDPPRIAILDWMMPGKDGVEICRDLLDRPHPFIYRILLTSKSEREDLLHALDNGAHDFQSKPIEPDILRSRVSVGKRLVEAREGVIRTERMAAVATLVRGIAHQFNNLNVGILGYVDLLLKNEYLDPSQQKRLEKIRGAVYRSQDITSMLVSLAQPRAPSRTAEALDRPVREAIEIVRHDLDAKGIELVAKIESVPPLPMSRADVAQVILHLLSNAEHAVLDSKKRQITVETGVEEDRVYARVKDTGCGIPATDLQSIFTPFFSTKGVYAAANSAQSEAAGPGLGLTVSETIIRQHGGSLTVESEMGRGSAFTVWLPLQPGDD
jgi:signal transduction histidine kinase